MKRIAIVAAMLACSAEARTQSTALVLELEGAEPIGVRVFVTWFKGGCADPSGTPLRELVLKPGERQWIDSPARYFCVQQTLAPFTKTGWSTGIKITHWTEPLLLRFRSRTLDMRVSTLTPTPPPPLPASAFVPVANAGAPGYPPLILELAGKEPIGVRVSAGTVTPCTSSENVPLYGGVLSPGKPLAIRTDASMVCVQRTRAPFVNTDWNEGVIVTRPVRCVAKNVCVADDSVPWRVALPSRIP